MIAFDWPWLLLLAPLPLAMAFLRSTGDPAPSPALPPRLSDAIGTDGGRAPARSRLVAGLLWVAWLAALLAAAQPYRRAGAEIAPASGRALMLVIDLSGSMERRDFVLDGVAVDRLSAVKAVAARFSEQRTGDRIGLVLFGDEAFLASPLTFDRSAVANLIRESAIGMAGRTTAIGDALGLAIVRLRDDPAAERAIVLLSDGTNNAGGVEPETAARLAAKENIRIHAIGLGSVLPEGSGEPIDPSADLDEATLRAVAEASGGAFFRVRTLDELSAAYADIDRMERAEAAAPPVVPRTDLAWPFLLALAAALAAIAGRRAWRTT